MFKEHVNLYMGASQFEDIWYIAILAGFVAFWCYYKKCRVFFRDLFSDEGIML